jgi:hypothetical protein
MILTSSLTVVIFLAISLFSAVRLVRADKPRNFLQLVGYVCHRAYVGPVDVVGRNLAVTPCANISWPMVVEPLLDLRQGVLGSV